jgi:hypothetical protein
MPASMIAEEAVYERRTYSVQDPSTVMELPGRIRTPSRAANCAKDVASPNGSRTHRHRPPDGFLNCHCGNCSARRWQKSSQLSSSWRRRNVAIWSNDSRTRKARTCEGTDVPKSDSTFSRPNRAAMLVEARIHPTWIPVKMQTTYLQCGHRSICRVVYTHVKWPSIEPGISSLRFLHCNAYLWARSNNF